MNMISSYLVVSTQKLIYGFDRAVPSNALLYLTWAFWDLQPGRALGGGGGGGDGTLP